MCGVIMRMWTVKLQTTAISTLNEFIKRRMKLDIVITATLNVRTYSGTQSQSLRFLLDLAV